MSLPKLTEGERRVLRFIEFRPQATAPEIAYALGSKAHVVSYTVRKLKQLKLIRLRPLIDHYRLGYGESGIYFTFSSMSKKDRRALEQHLVKEPQVLWSGAFAGEFQHAAVVLHRSFLELQAFMDKVIAKTSTGNIRQVIVPRISQELFARKYLATLPSKSLSFLTESTHAALTLDALDQKILNHLGTQSIHSARDSARALGLPFSTFERRVKNLEREQVILGYCYEFDCQHIGMHVYKLLLNLQRGGAAARQKIATFCKQHSQIINCLATLGNWDLELRVEGESEEVLMRCLDELLEHCGDEIAHYRVLSYLKQLKNSYSI